MGLTAQLPAAQATPRPWFPSVVVTNTIFLTSFCTDGACNSSKVTSAGRPSSRATAREESIDAAQPLKGVQTKPVRLILDKDAAQAQLLRQAI